MRLRGHHEPGQNAAGKEPCGYAGQHREGAAGGRRPQELDILNATVSGRLKTLIVRGEAEEVGAKMAACKPAYFDVLPLSLEEIFIYELGGVDYEIKDILL